MRKTEYRVRLLRKPRDGVQLHVTLAAHYRPSAAESVRAAWAAADAAAAAEKKNRLKI